MIFDIFTSGKYPNFYFGYQINLSFLGVFILTAYEFISALTLICYYRTKLADPGFIDEKIPTPNIELLPEDMLRVCEKCNWI